MFQNIDIKDAVGTVLAHDLTRIIPGKLKEPAYRKGHIVQKDDIPELLKMGHGGLCLDCEECRYPTCPFTQ